jgi:hypothetical protein
LRRENVEQRIHAYSKDRTTTWTSVGPGDLVVFTGVPPGAGNRMGVDRDRDTFFDRTEAALGFDPADPNSNPWEFR